MEESPDLRFLHSEESLIGSKLEIFRRVPTDELKASLAIGKPSALKTREDGTVLDGHHRLAIRRERGVNIHSLPREIILKGL
jgi:hypothetical protein